MESPARTVLFWMFIILVGVVLFKMASTKEEAVGRLRYSEFLEHAEKGNVRQIFLYLSQNSAEVQGELREPSVKFRATIPRESIPDLTRLLRGRGVPIDVAERSRGDWMTSAAS